MASQSASEALERAELGQVDVWILCELIEEQDLPRHTVPNKMNELWKKVTGAYCERLGKDVSSPEALVFWENILRKKWKNEKYATKLF